MYKLEIKKQDLQTVRDALYDQIPGFGCQKRRRAIIKLLRRVNRLIADAYGHDCNGRAYLCANAPSEQPRPETEPTKGN
jgi:hypothetical protein